MVYQFACKIAVFTNLRLSPDLELMKKPLSDSESAKNSGIGTYAPVLENFHDQNFVGQCYKRSIDISYIFPTYCKLIMNINIE